MLFAALDTCTAAKLLLLLFELLCECRRLLENDVLVDACGLFGAFQAAALVGVCGAVQFALG